MSVPPTLVIAIATFNRASYVTLAVESLQAQANTSYRWRVVVVDNNSRDETSTRLAELSARWPRLTALHEPIPGASAARNAALAWTADDYILFADDECKFPADYVDRALAILDARSPKMFGGSIHPWYVEPPPRWWLAAYGSYSLPWATGRADRVSLSAGNMGFQVDALRAIGGFDTERGPRGAKLAFGEETFVENRMLEKFGADAVWFDPDFFNFHAVRPEKYRWRHLVLEAWLRGRARAEVSAAGLATVPGPVPECLRPRPEPPGTAPTRWRHWQHYAVHYGLAAVRRAGQLTAR